MFIGMLAVHVAIWPHKGEGTGGDVPPPVRSTEA